jgi:hypothetical protein
MIALGELLDQLGPTLLRAVMLFDPLQAVRAVAVLDIGGPQPQPGALIVVPGPVHTDATLFDHLGTAGAVAVRDSADGFPADLLERARACGTSLLVIPPDVSLDRLTVAVRELVTEDVGSHTPVGDDGDLFAIAGAVAELAGGPVTIEDPQSRLLAFSTHVENVDAVRAETILRRAAPRPNIERMRKYGVFDRLNASPGPIFVRGRPPDISPRVALAVRAGQEILGSIWIAVDAPLDADREQALQQAASTVALHLLRRRVEVDSRRRTRTALVRALLSGDGPLAARHGWAAAGTHLRVIAMTVEGIADEDTAWLSYEMAEALERHLTSLVRRTTVAVVDATVYGIVASASTITSDKDDVLLKYLREFLGRSPIAQAHRIQLGLGRAVAAVADLMQSRAEADEALLALRASGHAGCARLEDVGAIALARHLDEFCRAHPEFGGQSAARLGDWDRHRGSALAATVYAYLDENGEVDRVAERLGVHPNTVRNRLRQADALVGPDLADPQRRLALHLHLRALLATPEPE